jgi:carbonic anhydrase/acetyltransferase-like protein (isoleucine patch superfamily)
VIFWADDLGREIFVDHRGARIGTGRRVLGGAVGHGSVLGARTIVAPGVALPNRTTVVMRRDEGVTKIESVEAGTPLCWDDARLVPYGALRPGHVPDEIATLTEDSRAAR